MTLRKYYLQSVVFVVLAVLISEAASGEEPQSRFKAAVIQATELFVRMRETFQQSVIKPAEQDQALRYLRRLSRRLDMLAMQKDAFAREVRLAKLPDNDGHLVPDGRDLVDAVQGVQASLTDTFSALPDQFRVSSREVRNNLDVSMNTKLESLQAISTFVGASSPSREQIVLELKSHAELTRTLRDEVDAFAAKLRLSAEQAPNP